MSPRVRKRATADGPQLANLPPIPTDPPQGFALLSPTEERRERELEDIIDEIGSDGRVKVWSIIDGKSTYAGDMSAEGFSLEGLMDAYGGGDKTLVFMQGKTKVDTFKVSLDPSIPARNPRQPKAVATANGASPAMDTANFMTLMAKSSLDNAQAMNQMMTGVMGALVAVMTATKPTTDPVDVALKMAEALKDRGSGGSVTEAMAMFREGMNLAERYAGNDKDDDGIMPVVGKGMDMLASLIDGIVTEKKAKAAAVSRQLPAPAPTTDAPPPPESSLSENGNVPQFDKRYPVAPPVRPWVDAARPHIAGLIDAASFLPPDAAARAIDNMLSDEQFDDLVDDLQDQTNGGFGARLSAYFPNDAQRINPEWFGQVVEILLNEYAADDGDESAGPTP